MTDDQAFLLLLAMLGFGGQILVQVILSIFQRHDDRDMRRTLDATHLIVNSQRTEMLERIETLEALLRDKNNG